MSLLLQVVFQKAMKTASLHDLKSDLKNLFINRYVGHGFKLPVIMFSGKFLDVGAILVRSSALLSPILLGSCLFKLVGCRRWWRPMPVFFLRLHRALKLLVICNLVFCLTFWKP